MNGYAQVTQLAAAMRKVDTDDNEELARVIERVSRSLDDLTSVFFFSQTGTFIFDAWADPEERTRQWLPLPLLSITSCAVDKDGDGVFETALTESTHFRARPFNELPRFGLQLLPNAPIPIWPKQDGYLQIAGVFGYSDETEAVALTGTLSDATDTSLTTNAAADSLIGIGDTLVIESEQMDVTAVSGTTVTVVRGINGTTAAGHSGKAITRRRFLREAEDWTIAQAARVFREEQSGFSGQVGNSEFGGYSFASQYPRLRDLAATMTEKVWA